MRNAFGHAEVIEGAVSSADNFASRGFDLSWTQPRVWGSMHRLRVGAFDAVRDLSRWSSYRLHNRGLTAGLVSASGRHELSYEAAYREVAPALAVASSSVAAAYAAGPSRLSVTQPASGSILDQCRASFKSALKYAFTLDGRDSKAAPTRGSSFSVTTEIAGLGGDVNFVKLETDSQYHFPLTNSLVRTQSTPPPGARARKRVLVCDC
jgi:outer membrane protein insertion porin family